MSVLEQRVGTGPDMRDFEREIAQVRRDKEAAIDVQNFEGAAVLRDRESQLLNDKAAREQEWATLQSLSEEIERLRDLLRRHGIDPQDGAAEPNADHHRLAVGTATWLRTKRPVLTD